MLTDKQERFCREYVIDYNATQAALRAGYSKNSTKQAAWKLLELPVIRARIVELNTKILDKLEVTNEWIMSEMHKIASLNAQDFVNGGNSILELKNLDRDKTAAVSKIKTTVRESQDGGVTTTTEIGFWDKLEALDRLAAIKNMYKDHQQAGATEINVSFEE